MAYDLLIRLGYNKKFASRVSWIVGNHMRFHFFVQNEEADEKKWMRKEIRSGEFRDSQSMREAWLQLAKVVQSGRCPWLLAKCTKNDVTWFVPEVTVCMNC